MKGFTPLKRNCPICNGTRSDCRQSQETGIVHCRADLNSLPTGWKFIKDDAWGFGMYAQTSEETNSQQWQQRQQERSIQRQRELEELRRGAMPEAQRDRAIRRIHSHFGLSPKHRQNLRDRGLSDTHINRFPYFSFIPNQPLPPLIPANLPGVRWGKLSVEESGMSCPILNIDGLIIGWQSRFDNSSKGKYRWPRGKKSVHLPNGELPIGVYRPDGVVIRRAIGHSEGFLKADIIAQTWGLPTLGAASANFVASPQQWHSSLERLAAEFLTRQIDWFADAGAVSNPHVTSHYIKAWEQLREWGYSVQVVWWGQIDKSDGDADEISPDVRASNLERISTDEYIAIARTHGGFREHQPESDRVINPDEWELKHGFGKFVKSHLSKVFRGFGTRPEPRTRPLHLQVSSDGVIEFQPGERLKTIAQLRSLGWKYILDRSPTGSGKSHDAGATHPDPDSGGKVWYLAANHRNPTVETVEQMRDLPPRHNGQVIEAGKLTPLGNPYVRNLRKGEDPDSLEMTPGNCHRADWFAALKAKGYNPEQEQADGRNPICGGCPALHSCVKGGFLGQRKEALKAERLRAHINSLPRPTEFNFSQDSAYVEEADLHLSGAQVIEAPTNEIAAFWGRFEREAPDAFETLKTFRNSLGEALQGEFDVIQNGRNRGANHEVLLNNLPSPDTIPNLLEVINQVRRATLKLADLIVEADSVTGVGGKWRAAGDFARSHFRRQAAQESLANIENAPTNILIHALEVWAGLKQGSLRCYRGKLTVTVRDTRNANILRSFGTVVLMDATADKRALAQKLNIDPSEIVEIRQASPKPNNLTVVNVKMPGMGSNEVSDSCKQRQVNLLNAIRSRHEGQKVLVLANKSDNHLPLDGYWFRDNRGSNEFKGTDVLVAFNTPRPNLGAIEDEYRAIFGSLEGFEQHYQHRIASEILQLIGRPRANLYPNQQITVYLVSTGLDLEFLKQYGVKLCSIEAFQICPEAGTPDQVTRWKIWEATRTITQQGGKLTQEAIASLAGKSQELVSKISQQFGGWKQMKKLLLALLQPYRGGNNFSALSDEERWLADSYLPALLQEAPEVAAEQMGQLIRTQGWGSFLLIVTAASPKTQARVLGLVLQILPIDLQLELSSLAECT